MRADLMFSVGDFELIEQAVVAFDGRVDAQWPLDEINEALAAFYQSTLEIPTLNVVSDLRRAIGYVILPRDDYMSDQEKEEIFWTCLADANLAHAGNKEFLVELPRWAATPIDPEVGNVPCAAVAYAAPYGPALPVEPINSAIRLLMGQQGWPECGAIYLYPVRKGNDPLYSGLWLADCIDGMDEADHIDDSIFTSIREQNLIHRHVSETFKRKRYDW